MKLDELERQIGAYIKTLADAADNSGSDFNQGVVRGLEIAAAQFEHGHAREHIPALSDALTRLKAEVERKDEALDDLQQAEAEYRLMHDRHGDGSQAAGRAWDLMRRAGDKARAALSQEEEGR